MLHTPLLKLPEKQDRAMRTALARHRPYGTIGLSCFNCNDEVYTLATLHVSTWMSFAHLLGLRPNLFPFDNSHHVDWQSESRS